jgi:hypothetical protein
MDLSFLGCVTTCVIKDIIIHEKHGGRAKPQSFSASRCGEDHALPFPTPAEPFESIERMLAVVEWIETAKQQGNRARFTYGQRPMLAESASTQRARSISRALKRKKIHRRPRADPAAEAAEFFV